MESNKATLDSCETSGCGWKCCNIPKDGGHIILLPEELETAKGSTNHLEVIDDSYNGGKKVICKAKDTANCDGGYKPVQCGVYPLWVTSGSKTKRSMKCPLSDLKVSLHKKEAIEVINEYKENHPNIDLDDFLDKAEVDRYEDI